MIAKEFIPEKGTRSFAIMSASRYVVNTGISWAAGMDATETVGTTVDRDPRDVRGLRARGLSEAAADQRDAHPGRPGTSTRPTLSPSPACRADR